MEINIDASRLHTFTPSRPNGVVCVAERIVFMNQGSGMATVCGYPAGHPIHGVYVQPASATPIGEQLTAQDCADALRAWVRQMPGGGSRYLDQLLALAQAAEDEGLNP